MMHKLVMWLALCGLILVGSNSRLSEAGRAFEPPGRLLGISFAAPDAEERRQTSESELRRATMRQLENSNNEPEERASTRYSTSKEELQRRARLNRILDAIGASLAPISTQPSGQQQQQQQVAGESTTNLHAPLHRSGRIYPARETSDTLRGFRLAAATGNEYQSASGLADGGAGSGSSSLLRARADQSIEQWEPSMLDGGSGSAKSQRSAAIRGLVWPSNRPITSGGSPPFYSSLNVAVAGLPRQHVNTNEAPQASTIYGANQQRARSGLLLEAGAKSQHHRSGTSEEVALQTPVHSRSTSDYEWKRVEQSRWNNLRGMWGKRSAMRDDEDPAEKYKELVEWEASAQREAAERAAQDADELPSSKRSHHEDKQQQQAAAM